ncbi:MAG: enoyl-CoA hydratase-related protein, partial [Pseudomonadota bacterium]
MSERILVERDGRVLTITNNDPASRNSISADFYVGFREAVDAAASDDGIRAIVLTGAGDFFCSGGNLHGLKERSEATREDRL